MDEYGNVIRRWEACFTTAQYDNNLSFIKISKRYDIFAFTKAPIAYKI